MRDNRTRRDKRTDVIVQLLGDRGLVTTWQEPWKCGCLVRDPVDNTLHWVIQPSWVGRCDKCGHVTPRHEEEDMTDA